MTSLSSNFSQKIGIIHISLELKYNNKIYAIGIKIKYNYHDISWSTKFYQMLGKHYLYECLKAIQWIIRNKLYFNYLHRAYLK